MLPIHFLFIWLCDVYAYRIDICNLLLDIVFVWLDYYNYMTVDKLTCIVHVVLMFF